MYQRKPPEFFKVVLITVDHCKSKCMYNVYCRLTRLGFQARYYLYRSRTSLEVGWPTGTKTAVRARSPRAMRLSDGRYCVSHALSRMRRRGSTMSAIADLGLYASIMSCFASSHSYTCSCIVTHLVLGHFNPANRASCRTHK